MGGVVNDEEYPDLQYFLYHDQSWPSEL